MVSMASVMVMMSAAGERATGWAGDDRGAAAGTRSAARCEE